MNKAYSSRIEYDNDSVEFINKMGIGYAQEIYEENKQCTICEDGLPKAWCWELKYTYIHLERG